MTTKEVLIIFNVQYPMYKELQYIHKNGGLNPTCMRLLWLLDFVRGSSTLLNPRRAIIRSGLLQETSTDKTLRILRQEGYITKLSKFEYRFEDKAIKYVKDFNERMEIKTRAYLERLPERFVTKQQGLL